MKRQLTPSRKLKNPTNSLRQEILARPVVNPQPISSELLSGDCSSLVRAASEAWTWSQVWSILSPWVLCRTGGVGKLQFFIRSQYFPENAPNVGLLHSDPCECCLGASSWLAPSAHSGGREDTAPELKSDVPLSPSISLSLVLIELLTHNISARYWDHLN